MLVLSSLSKSYDGRPVFQGIDLTVQAGEIVALVGDSGVGKSTLLQCIAGLDRPDAGTIVFDGVALAGQDDEALSRWRRAALGFVFQAFHVLPHLTVAQNVGLPLRLLGVRDDARVAQMLALVELDGLGDRWPAQLSGGQLQRVAIARALVHRPRLVLADEPTGNLDPGTAQRVMALLAAQVRQQGAACLLVTHADAVAAMADRVLRLRVDGVAPAPDAAWRDRSGAS